MIEILDYFILFTFCPSFSCSLFFCSGLIGYQSTGYKLYNTSKPFNHQQLYLKGIKHCTEKACLKESAYAALAGKLHHGIQRQRQVPCRTGFVFKQRFASAWLKLVLPDSVQAFKNLKLESIEKKENLSQVTL